MNKHELDESIRVGETVDVQTSHFDRRSDGSPLYPPDWRPRFYANAASVRALLRSGRYSGETFWRGATITKLSEDVPSA